MLKEKTIEKISKITISLALVISLVFLILGSGRSLKKTSTTISTVLNKDSVMNINIDVKEEDWNYLLENATDEEYICGDITINDETFYNVGIRAKGNSSLSQVASSNSDRYSLKINFGKYVDGQTYHGIEKLALNNNITDTTSMKEYLTYDMYEFLGVNTPEYCYANIDINNSDWGLYLAVEDIGERFVEKNYGSTEGNLYKPEIMDMGGGNKGNGGGMPDMPKGDFPGGNEGVNPSKKEENSATGTTEEVPNASNGAEENSTNNNKPQPGENFNPGDMENGKGNFPAMPEGGGNNGEGQAPNMPQNGNGQAPDMPQNGDGQQQFQGNGPMEGNMNGQVPNMPKEDGTSENSQEDNTTEEEEANSNEKNNMNPNMGGNKPGMGGFGGNNAGADFKYIDDNIESYSTLRESAIFDKTTDKDFEKVITMLKNLNDGTNLEEYLNVEEILKYFAVNTFAVNLDSYSGGMFHNYYLYEEDGVCEIIPWDLNMSFGGFNQGTSGNAINFPIDNPVTGTLEDYPLIAKLLEVDEYKELYHSYLEKLANEYIGSDNFSNKVLNLNSLINDYIENDPTAFYTYEEYKNSLPQLITFGEDRAKSVLAQLSGEQPSTSYGDMESSVDMSALGSMMGGMDKGNGPNNGEMTPPDGQQMPENFSQGNAPKEDTNNEGNINPNENGDNPGGMFNIGDMPSQEVMEKAMEIINEGDGETLTEEQKNKLLELGISEELIEKFTSNSNFRNMVNKFQGMNGMEVNSSKNLKNYIAIVVGALVAMILSIIFVSKYKRKRYKM